MPNADAIALGKQIKAVRKAMKMTQDQLALKSNVSMKYIANIENGKQNPSFDILSAILHVLPLSLDSVINPNLSGAERECRELESIYLACPPEMRKTLLDATRSLATVYKGNIIKNLIMDCQSYTKYRPNETTGGIFVSWRRKEELPTGA